ncbi:MAG: LuxE/PaaK family acyltransferase [Candidatus Helarchaeota archaeon]
MNEPKFFEDLRQEIKKTADDCNYYNALCRKNDYDFDMTLNDSNLEDIPFINWNLFKASNKMFDKLLRIPFEKLAYWTISSSTTGDPSIVGRGPEDISVFQENYKKVFEEYSHMSQIKKLILFSPKMAFLNRMPGRWMGKRGYLFYRDITDIWNIDTTFLLFFNKWKAAKYMLTHFRFKAFIEVDGKAFERELTKIEHKRIPALIANSAPLIFKTVFDYKKKTGRTFDMPESFRIQTGGGGWSGIKGRVKTMPIDKIEFIELLSEFFNITSENFADLFGATETPAAFGGHWSKNHNDFLLHVDKNTARIILRSINDLERIKTLNQEGILEIITPYGVKSYAGIAVLLDDIVQIVNFNRCPECGRENVIVFRHVGRLTPEIGKGCSSYTRLFPFAE